MDWSGYAFDLTHVFVGETPSIFFFEVFGRTALLFLFALFLVRLLGKRSLGQVSPYEFVVLIAMGSALGDPMFYPNVPLLPPMLVMATIVLIQRLVSLTTEKSQRLEHFIEGQARECVRDGVAVMSALNREHIDFGELAMLLRQKGIEVLGDVRLAILEPSGQLSVFPFHDGPDDGEPRLGLPLEVLIGDADFERFQAGDRLPSDGTYACTSCGQCRAYASAARFISCSNCGREESVRAAAKLTQPRSV